MKKTTKPRPSPLAAKLFEVGMDSWRKVDKHKSKLTLKELSTAQIAAWNAIADYVNTIKHHERTNQRPRETRNP